jgi:putative oxidoreductase
MSLALLVLRVVVGALFIGHGSQKLFGSFGGHGIEGTGQFLAQLGYRPGHRHALLAGMAEFAGGLLLAVGLFTPLAAAIVIGVMVNAIGSVHGKNGPWMQSGGYEYHLVLIASMFVVAATGPGVASIDHAIGLDLHGTVSGLGALVLGLATGAAVLGMRKPDVDAPDVNAPDVNAPDVDAPDVDAPDVDAPDVNARAGEGRASAPLTAEETLELGR